MMEVTLQESSFDSVEGLIFPNRKRDNLGKGNLCCYFELNDDFSS